MGAFIFAGGDPSKVDVSGYAKGDVLAADTAGTLQPVAVGPDGDVLTADSVATEGVDWQPGGGGGGGVNSVFTRTGNVVAQSGDYTKAQVGLGNVDNTSDVNKPVSTAQATADTAATAAAVAVSAQRASNLIDLANVATARTNLGLGTAATQNTGAFDPAGAAAAAQAASQPLDSDLTTIAGLTATTDNIIQSVGSAWASRTPAQVKTALSLTSADVGLGNVDNTSDANKPVSTAQQTALNLKANLASPTFTGTVTTAKITSPSVALTDASTVVVDASLGNYFRLLLTAGIGATRALGAPSNPSDGQKIMLELIQSSGGSNALTYNGIYTFGTDIASATLSTAANKRDFLGVVYNSTANLWYVIAFVKGY